MELLLALTGVAGGTIALLRTLHGRGMNAATTLLVSMLTVTCVGAILASYVLLAGLGMLAAGGAIGLAGALGVILSKRSDSSAATALRDARDEVRGSPLVWSVAVVLVTAQVTLSTLTSLSVGDIGWDAGTYHLPTVGSMIQEGSLFGFPDLRAWTFYPALIEVQAALLGSGLGSMRAASLVQLGYWVWLIAFAASVLTGSVRRSSAVAGLLVIASIPTLWLQPRTLYVDVAFATIFAAASLVLTRSWQHRDRRLLLVAAALIGALFGIKLGALSAIPLAAAVAAVSIWTLRMRASVVMVVVLGIMGAGPYMVRNAIEWSNPLYPVSLTEPREPVDSWPGYAPYSLTEIEWYVDASQRPPSLRDVDMPRALATQYVTQSVRELGAVFGVAEAGAPSRTARYDSREGGFGAAWLATMVATALAAAAVTKDGLRGGRRPGRLGTLATALALLGGATAAALITQSAWWPRFMLGPAIVSVIAGMMVLDRTRLAPLAAAGLVTVATIGLITTEGAGGYAYWTSCEDIGCVPDPDDRALVRKLDLSGLTLPFAPLAEAEPSTVAIVGDPPNFARPYFPAGLWSPGWEAEIHNLTIHSQPSGEPCFDAYVVDAGDATMTLAWASAADPEGRFTLTSWDDRGDQRALLLRKNACDA